MVDILSRRYGKADMALTQDDYCMDDEWHPVGGHQVRVLGDDVMAQIAELSKLLHITTGAEKDAIRARIRELKLSAGIEDRSVPPFGSTKKDKRARAAGYDSAAEYSSLLTQESRLRASLAFIHEALLIANPTNSPRPRL